MEYTKEQIEGMTLTEIRQIPFADCPCKCTDIDIVCDNTSTKDCREYLLNNLNQ